MRNLIAIQRGMILVPAAAGDQDSRQVTASLQAELMNLGFMLDTAAFAAASAAPRAWLIAYHEEVIPHLRKRLGADRSYQPFYRNFPTQVMETSHLQLFLNAVVHYWSDGTWEPPQVLRDRGFAFEDTEFRPVGLGTEDDLKRVFTKLASINQSWTEQDKEAVNWLIDTYGHELKLPDVIPFKETLCILAAKGLDVPLKTPKDVLRVAVYLSGGDISLPGVPTPTLKEPWPGLHRWHLEQLRAAQQQARGKFKFKKFIDDVKEQIGRLLQSSC